jgi:hypothetical protein
MLEGLTPPVRILPCLVRTIMEQLDEADQKILDAALEDQVTWGHTALAQALTQRGLRISEMPIRKHRAGRCSCE